ncbi:MAG: hypothetical protein HEEMFOPI_01774 [Holosporales bacterium]
MKILFWVFFISISFCSFAAQNEIFGKLIIRVDQKNMKYIKPGSFTDTFPIRPDQGVIFLKKFGKKPFVLTHVEEIQSGYVKDACEEGLKFLQEMKTAGLSHRTILRDQDNCLVVSDSKKETTIQWLHRYKFKSEVFILSIATTQSIKDFSKSVTAIEAFVKDSIHELQ